jgi:hypothetical protein
MWCSQIFSKKSGNPLTETEKATNPSMGSMACYFAWKIYYYALYNLEAEKISHCYWLSGQIFSPSGVFWCEYMDHIAYLNSLKIASKDPLPLKKFEPTSNCGLLWSKRTLFTHQNLFSHGRWRSAPTRNFTFHRPPRCFFLASHRVYSFPRWIGPVLVGSIRMHNYLPK